MRLLAATLCAALLAPVPALAYRMVTVTDGDTLTVSARGPAADWVMRLRGIDTPEINGACLEEQAKAQEARQRLIDLTRRGVEIQSDLSQDAYARFLVRIFTREGQDVAEVLVREGLARPYDGRGPRQTWCPPGSTPAPRERP